MKDDAVEVHSKRAAETEPGDQTARHRQGSKKLIKVARLLAIDAECEAANALNGVVGDRYLYCHNAIFRSIRDAAIYAGCDFSAADSRLLRNYLSLPLFSLANILAQRTIPYLENAYALEEVLRQNADTALPVRFLLQNIRPNYLLHEASHFVGEQKARDEAWEFCESPRQRFTITSILIESFANTIERLASSGDCHLIHAIFFRMNSYMDYEPARWTVANRGLKAFGLHAVYKLAFLSYVLSNISDDKITAAIVDRIAELIWERPLCQDERELVVQLIGFGYRINSKFRDETSRLYFRWHGCESEFASLQASSLIMDDHTSEAILGIMTRLSRIVLPDPSKSVAGPSNSNADAPLRSATH